MNTSGILIYSLFVLLLLAPTASAEIVVVTRPLPDLNGDIWQREYFDVDHALFDIPQGVTITAGSEPTPIRPTITLRTVVKDGKSVVEDAWVNIVDIVNNRYYAGNFNKWYDLDSTELIRVREGYDTCAVYFRICDRPGAPPDSCRTVRTSLHKSLSMSDIAYIAFTSFDTSRDVNREVYRKSGYFFRNLLGYVVRDVPLDTILDSPSAEVKSWPIGCGCLHDFGPQSIRKAEFLFDASE